MIHTKECTNCQEEKNISSFPKNKRNKDGLDTHCKTCRNQKNKNFRQKDIVEFRRKRKEKYHKNLDQSRAERRKYANPHKKREYDKKYRPVNKERIAKYKRDWTSKMKNEPSFKIRRNLRRRVHHALKGLRKKDNTFNLIGCTVEDFKFHIESLWKEGMSWENYGPTGWHIDHIIPCYKFDLSLEEEQRKCFHYTNQRPLWAWENLSRSRRE